MKSHALKNVKKMIKNNKKDPLQEQIKLKSKEIL